VNLVRAAGLALALAACRRAGDVDTLPTEQLPTSAGWLPLEICDGIALQPVPAALAGYPAWRCAKVCTRDDLCRYEEPERQEGRIQLGQLQFTVDGVPGRLRFPHRFEAAEHIRAGVFLQSGGGGDEWGDHNHSLWEPLEKDGLMVIGVRWDPMTNPRGHDDGWVATTTDAQPDYPKTTRRVAEVIRFAHDRLLPAGRPFGVIGTSNGGLATVGAVAWYGLDPIVDWQVINSGALNADLSMKCRFAEGEKIPGVCEDNPDKTCDADGDCGGGQVRCAFPEMGEDREDRLDRIFQADHICTTARDRLLRASLAGGVPADLAWDHPVDFIIAEGKSQAEAKWDDTNAGMTWQMAWLWRHLQSPDKRWHDLQGYAHAVAMGQPELEPLIQCAARRALKLPGTKGCEVP